MDGIRRVIMGVATIVLLGYLMIWIVAPTNVYKLKWQPTLRLKTTSTFFGTSQGANLLIYTFPPIFIAVLGSLFLHLGKKSPPNTQKGKKDKLAIWKRPVIMKGLGIVSRIELAFFVMFIALLVWSFATYLHVGFAKITPKTAAKNHEKVWESKLKSASLRLGLVGNIVLAILFYPVTRGTSVLPVFGLTSEASVKYHIWLGHIMMALFTSHGICYTIYWAVTHQASQLLKWEKTGVSNVAGEISLLCGLVMWATTFPKIRRKMFELFFYIHYLYIPFVIFFIYHVGVSYASMMLPGFYLFALDRYLRFLQSRQNVRLLSARILPCETVELNFSKTADLSYTPTSIMFVNIPSISKLQWHPFTISSNSSLEDEKLSVVVKSEGSWSNKLYQILSSKSSKIDHLDCSIEGPYGPPSSDFLRHDTLVMVSGGSGITPFISIFREFVFMNETLNLKTPKLVLITSFKNSNDLTMLELLLPSSNTPFQLSKLDFKIEAYVTREKHPNMTNNKDTPGTIWFKPNPKDSPIAPVLGPNNWLWLAAIISSSFVIFLVLMGILTRYYIYPIDHNNNKIYSYAARASLQMLLLCIAIIVSTGSAFVWNKKKNVMGNKQIQNMEGASPTSSPNSWFYNADRELESLPQQSLAQSTTLHFGERPDLKNILFERKESSVGVLVCGPKKMRHEVANICSSGLGKNLHFESISFSW